MKKQPYSFDDSKLPIGDLSEKRSIEIDKLMKLPLLRIKRLLKKWK